MMQMQSRFQLILRERSRLAREIHDTVLQGFAGVVFQLDAASRSFEKSPGAAKERLDRALGQADRSMQEARKAITSMRLPALESNSLVDALSAMGKEAVDGTRTAFRLTVKGDPEVLRYQVQAAFYLIAREAIANAVAHAGAHSISLGVICSDSEATLVVKDDGVGFDLHGSSKEGHFGLAGMKERAEGIKATIDLTSEVGNGTTVAVRVERDQRDEPKGSKPRIQRLHPD
jgi:signal transduction histidine kinase